MITSMTASSDKLFRTSRNNMALTLDEDGLYPIIFNLPPIEEIDGILKISIEMISLSQLVEQKNIKQKEFFTSLLFYLKNTEDKHEKTAAYYNRLASIAELAGNNSEAEDYLTRAVDKKKDSTFLQNRLLRTYINADENSKIKPYIDTDSDDVNILFSKAVYYVYKCEYKQAYQYLEKAIKIDRLDYNVRSLMGILEIVFGNYHKAIRHFRVGESINSNSCSLHVNIGVAYLLLGNVSKAISYFKRALHIYPLSRNALIILSDLLLRNKKYNEVVGYLEFYLDKERKDAELWDRLAKVYFRSKQYNKAINTLNIEASIDDGPRVWNNLALVYWESGNHEKARQYFSHCLKESIKSGTIDDVFLNNLFMFFDNQKYPVEMRQIIGIVLPYLKRDEKLKPGYYSTIIYYITYLLRNGEEELSIKETEYFLAKGVPDPAYSELLVYALFYYSIVKPDNTIVQRYITLAEEIIHEIGVNINYRLLNNLIYSYIELGNYDMAGLLINKYKSQFGKNNYLYATYGYYLLKTGDLENAKKYYEHSITEAVTRIDKKIILNKYQYELGKYYLTNNNDKEAYKLINTIIKDKKGYKYIRAQAVKLLEGVHAVAGKK